MTDIQFLLCKLSECASELTSQIVICNKALHKDSAGSGLIHLSQLHENIDGILVIFESLKLSPPSTQSFPTGLMVEPCRPEQVAVEALKQCQQLSIAAMKAAQFGLDSALPDCMVNHRDQLHNTFARLMQHLGQINLQAEVCFTPCPHRQRSAIKVLMDDFLESRKLGFCLGGSLGLSVPTLQPA